MPVGIVRLVHVHVDVGIVRLGDLEGDLDVARSVVHVPLAVRHTAHHRRPTRHRLPHQIHRFGVPGQAQLGEGNDLDVKHAGELIARRADGIQQPHFCDLVDVHVVAHPQRAVGDRHAQGARRAGHDVLAAHVAFDIGINVDRFAQRAAGIHGVVEEGVLEVKVGIDESRREHRAIGFDSDPAGRQVIFLQRDDLATGDPYVNNLIRVCRAEHDESSGPWRRCLLPVWKILCLRELWEYEN